MTSKVGQIYLYTARFKARNLWGRLIKQNRNSFKIPTGSEANQLAISKVWPRIGRGQRLVAKELENSGYEIGDYI